MPNRKQKNISLPLSEYVQIEKKAKELGVNPTRYIREICLKEAHSWTPASAMGAIGSD